MGGRDPYSASKAAAEWVAASYRQSFFDVPQSPLVATARAGNVIGGGDWSEDRLVPDAVRAVSSGKVLEIRSPKATRPWQHVLEPLAGYLLLGGKLLEGSTGLAEAWNFGPDKEGDQTVEGVLSAMQKVWPDIRWRHDTASQPHEAEQLRLDNTKAGRILEWHPLWNLERALDATANWYRRFNERGDVASLEQLEDYIATAAAAGAAWCGP